MGRLGRMGTSGMATDLDPIAAVPSFYLMVDAPARTRGLDPDAPHHLCKVTRTR